MTLQALKSSYEFAEKNTKVRESILDLLLDALMIQSFPWLKTHPLRFNNEI